MIDIENIVINKIIEELKDISVTSDETRTPASFPAVVISCNSNTVYLDSRDECKENHANILFQADIYDNDVNNKKEHCKTISKKLDDIMQSLGFTRTLCEPVANIEDATIYRMTMRFSAVVSKLIGNTHYIYDK